MENKEKKAPKRLSNKSGLRLLILEVPANGVFSRIKRGDLAGVSATIFFRISGGSVRGGEEQLEGDVTRQH